MEKQHRCVVVYEDLSVGEEAFKLITSLTEKTLNEMLDLTPQTRERLKVEKFKALAMAYRDALWPVETRALIGWKAAYQRNFHDHRWNAVCSK